MLDWLADPLAVVVIVLFAVVALLSGALRRWPRLTTAIYVLGASLMGFAILWAREFGNGAFYLVAAAGIGTGLAQYAVDRAQVEKTAAAEAPRQGA